VAGYSLRIKPSAVKELERLPAKVRTRTVARIRSLSIQPRPQGCEKLSVHDLYRLRQGDYRVLYTVQDADREVIVIKIGHRSEVYRRP
jgi:mRNA interferase RelE/StbE